MLGQFNFNDMLTQSADIIANGQSVGADGGIINTTSLLYASVKCSIQPVAGDQVPEYAKAGDVVSDHVLICDVLLTVPNGAMVSCDGLTYRVTFPSDAGGRGNAVGVVTEIWLRLVQP